MDAKYLPTTRDGKIARLLEEIGEVMIAAGTVQHVLGKIARHGWQTTDPHTGIAYNNQQMLVDMLRPLVQELGDLSHAVADLRPHLIDANGQLIDQTLPQPAPRPNKGWSAGEA